MLIRIKEKFNELFWQITELTGRDLKCLEVDHSAPFVQAKDNIDNKYTADLFRSLNDTELNGYFSLLSRRCVIEPSRGYAIVGLNKIVKPSIFMHSLLPSAGTYLNYRFFNRGRTIKVPKAILFDGNMGTNYFHFFTDVLNKLWVLEKYGVDRALPLIIGKGIFETKYFKYLYNNTEVGQWNWMVQQENDFIVCDSLYIIKPAPYSKILWDRTIALVQNLKSTAKPNRRFFVTRPKNNARGLSNTENFLPFLYKNGFEMIDPGSMTFEEQVRLFSEAEMVVALHGAAITNIMFSDVKNLKVLEIMPLNRTNSQLYWVALMLKVKYYDCIIGSSMIDSKFEIPVEVLEKAVARLMAYA